MNLEHQAAYESTGYYAAWLQIWLETRTLAQNTTITTYLYANDSRPLDSLNLKLGSESQCRQVMCGASGVAVLIAALLATHSARALSMDAGVENVGHESRHVFLHVKDIWLGFIGHFFSFFVLFPTLQLDVRHNSQHSQLGTRHYQDLSIMEEHCIVATLWGRSATRWSDSSESLEPRIQSRGTSLGLPRRRPVADQLPAIHSWNFQEVDRSSASACLSTIPPWRYSLCTEKCAGPAFAPENGRMHFRRRGVLLDDMVHICQDQFMMFMCELKWAVPLSWKQAIQTIKDYHRSLLNTPEPNPSFQSVGWRLIYENDSEWLCTSYIFVRRLL